jgi:hypothetical protein
VGLVLGAPPENLSPPRTVGRNDFLGTYDPVKGEWLYEDDPYGPNGFMSPRKGRGRDPGTGQRVHTAKAITPLSPCVRSSRNPGAYCVLPPPPLAPICTSHCSLTVWRAARARLSYRELHRGLCVLTSSLRSLGPWQ